MRKKNILGLRGLAVICLTILFGSACASVEAGLIFRMTSSQTTVSIGGSTIIQIFAYADDAVATGNNGLNGWQVDMKSLISSTGTLTVTSIDWKAPGPPFDSTLGTMDDPGSGDIKFLGVIVDGWLSGVDSTVGVGGFSLLAEVTVQGVSAGTVDYALGDFGSGFYGFLRDGEDFDFSDALAYGTTSFDASGSNTQYTVTPEPGSLLILTGLTGLMLRRRRGRNISRIQG